MAIVEGAVFAGLKSVLESCDFQELKAAFTQTGRGRRRNVALTVCNKLILQIYHIKESENKTWREMECFVCHILGRQDIGQGRIRTLTAKTLREVERQSEETINSFLAQPVDIDEIGEKLTKAGLTKAQLLQSSIEVRCSTLSIAFIVELLQFQKKHKLPFERFLSWYSQLTGFTVVGPIDTFAGKFKEQIRKLKKDLDKLQSNKGKPGGLLNLQSFLDASFVPVPSSSNLPQDNSVSESVNPQPAIIDKALNEPKHQEIGALMSNLAAIRRQLQESNKEKENLRTALSVFSDTNKKLLDSRQCSEKLRRQLNKEIIIKQTKQKALDKINDELQKKKKEVQALSRDNVLRRNKRLEATNRSLNIINIRLKDIIKENAKMKKKMRNKKDNIMRQIRKIEDRVNELTRLNVVLDKENKKLKNLIEAKEDKIMRLKDEQGFFKEEVIKCVMMLIGETEISADKCGVVIQAVAKYLFSTTVLDTDLPSKRSALRFADRAHVLSRMHVAESVLECENFDIHTDGTSRGGKKYVGQQLNIDGAVLTTGFSAVCVENTNTLVDITFNMLQELVEVFDENEAHINFVEMLERLSSMMTDRASVMKAFVEQFDTEVRDILQQETTIGFLRCNAHFLLGLSTECEKALTAAEKAGGEKLGRDKLPAFRSFADSKECSAARYIRTACDCLGPRGDDKNGCRDNWEAYCVMVGNKSLITSFKSNRFNNLFEAAAALHHHRADINTFMDLYLTKRNKKLDSILADSQCDTIDCHIVALGLVYYRITGPYWQLLGNDIHYLDFHMYVHSMMQLFERWADDPADAFDRHYQPLFLRDLFMPKPEVYESLLNISEEKKVKVMLILKALCQGFVSVTKRQMVDFLEEGKYFAVQDEDMRHRMRNARLTNLIGEKAFGDLDFSLFKRRRASLHHHSTVHMLKWNRSISTWLQLKDSKEQKRLLDLSGKKAAGLRQKHVMDEKNAVAHRRLLLEENHRQKQQAATKRSEKIEQIMASLRQHGGPCHLSEDVDRLLKHYSCNTDRGQAVKAELNYHKLVLQRKSPHLRITGRLPTLVTNLKVFLGADPATVEVPMVLERKRRRRTTSSDTLSVSDEFEDGSTVSSDEDKQDAVLESIHFSNTGELVAVHYDFEEDFFVGEVENIISPLEAEVNFMARLAIQKNLFHWPTRPDRCIVHKNFVIASNLTVSPATSSGRSVTLDNIESVCRKHVAYKMLYV